MLPLWKFLSFLGSEPFYLLIMPALLWCGDARLGLRVGVLFLLSANLNSVLKLYFHLPRPAWVDASVVAHGVEKSFGFPSGHAQNAAAVWGLLAAQSKKRPAWFVALGLIALIGISRLALNVHFPSDVLGGWVIGAVLLGGFLKLEKPVGYCLRRLFFAQQLMACAVVSFCFFGASWRIHQIVNEGGLSMAAIPWLAQVGGNNELAIVGIVGGLKALPIIKASGAFFGFLTGACLITNCGGYINGGNRIIRYAIGVFGVAILWFDLGEMVPFGDDLPALGMEYLRYSVVGFWISAGAPLVFRWVESSNAPPSSCD